MLVLNSILSKKVRFLKTNLIADISKKEKWNPLLFLYDSLGYPNTVIHSMWCVWGNIPTEVFYFFMNNIHYNTEIINK